MTEKRVMLLDGVVQHYEWGGYEFIPALLGVKNDPPRPFAELWFGAHPKAPSALHGESSSVALDRAIAQDPRGWLGERVAGRFQQRLPFLLKILDARKMLSIQAHPTKPQAEEGFARENAAGIPLDSTKRNYKDDNHKPEVHVALTDFYMLHGFRPVDAIAETLQSTPEFAALAARFSHADLRGLYQHVMTMPQSEVDAIVNPLLARIAKTSPSKDSHDFWALRAADDFPLPHGHRDRGILSIYLLNLLRLHPREATFQPAGVLHAYLEGVNVELMANSDNVLRGGLTPKHVDVPELLRTLTFDGEQPSVFTGDSISDSERLYRTPAAEFELSRIDIRSGGSHSAVAAKGPECLFVLEGTTEITTDATTPMLSRGQAVFVPFGAAYELTAKEPATLFKAAVPDSPK